MATRIPLPGNGAEALQKGVESGTNLWQQLLGRGLDLGKMHQQGEQFEKELAIKQQYQDHLAEQEARLRELQPYLIAAHQDKSDQAPLNLDLLKAKIDSEKAKAQKYKKGENPDKAARSAQLRTPWANMTTTQRENMAALANGLNIRPDVFVEGMTSGKTFEEIAREHGYNPEDISKLIPKYLPTARNASLENERQKNLYELNVIEDKVSDAMSPYVETFFGYSPKQIIDSFKGQNQDDLAKYLAARSLQPEIAALRIKVMGGNIGQGAIEELLHSSLGNSKVFQGQITPDVYKKMNHYVKEWLNEASKAATQSIYGQSTHQKESSNKENQQSRKRFNMITGELE